MGGWKCHNSSSESQLGVGSNFQDDSGGPDICVFGRLFMTNCRTGEGAEKLDRLFWRGWSLSWREALDEQSVLVGSGFPCVLASSFEK